MFPEYYGNNYRQSNTGIYNNKIKMKTDLTSALLIKSNIDLIMTDLLIKSLVIVHHDNKPKDSEVLTYSSFSW